MHHASCWSYLPKSNNKNAYPDLEEKGYSTLAAFPNRSSPRPSMWILEQTIPLDSLVHQVFGEL
jgi:hypothetical protein